MFIMHSSTLFRLSFRVRAVNSVFKGEFSDVKELSTGHLILKDSINDIKLVKSGDNWAAFRWNKLQPTSSSALYGKTWTYRISYSDLDNQFAVYDQMTLINDDQSGDQITLNITNLSPGSRYTFRFNVQMGDMSGPNVLKHVDTSGKRLPTPNITSANVSPKSGTSIKLTWELPKDSKSQSFEYVVYYGLNFKELLRRNQNVTTDKTSITVDKLHACESYSFIVAIRGPRGFGPPSVPYVKSTKYSPGAPPKNLEVGLMKYYCFFLSLEKINFTPFFSFHRHCMTTVKMSLPYLGPQVAQL